MKYLTLIFIGRDSWDRPVYEADGKLYVNADPRKGKGPEICTKCNNAFDGGPDFPIAGDIEIEFVPCRDIWD